jgi:feruloyl esterase
MMPGAAHCGGGPGANAVDYLGYLDAWVTRGQAPVMLKAAHLDSDDLQDFVSWPADATRIKFTRPLYPYPLQARYKRGDPNDYRSFAPVAGE